MSVNSKCCREHYQHCDITNLLCHNFSIISSIDCKEDLLNCVFG